MLAPIYFTILSLDIVLNLNVKFNCTTEYNCLASEKPRNDFT